jgi:N-acyl-D-aspartate/D-glutamate deacylase
VTYDTIIGNGRWFVGAGDPSVVGNIGIRACRVVAITGPRR